MHRWSITPAEYPRPRVPGTRIRAYFSAPSGPSQATNSVTSQYTEELNDLRALDAAWKQPEANLPEYYHCNRGELMPGEAVLQRRG